MPFIEELSVPAVVSAHENRKFRYTLKRVDLMAVIAHQTKRVQLILLLHKLIMKHR